MSERSRKSRESAIFTGADNCDEDEMDRACGDGRRGKRKKRFPGGGDPERLLHSSMAVDDDHSERERILNAVTIIVR